MALILVVDDVEFTRLTVSKMLVKRGFSVAQAADGLQAVQAYQAQRPDAVLLDVTMPEMDGLATLKAIRALDPTARVLMMTALDQGGVALAAIQLGAKDFIVKPFEAERLLTALDWALA